MPTASVVREGDLVLGYSTGPQVRLAKKPGAIHNTDDNYAVILGVLPHIEIGMSSLVSAPFNGMIDDRSVSAKWQPYSDSRSGFSLAIGATDIQGTRLRATDYAVASLALGSATVHAGYGHGVLSGAMAGASWAVRPNWLLAAEYVGSEFTGGAKARLTDRIWLGAALGKDRKAFYSASYAIPLATPVTNSPSNAAIGDLGTLIQLIGNVAKGDARSQIVDGVLVVSYEDVEARDPIVTFGKVLGLCTDFAGAPVGTISVTVRRFGRDLVTLRGRSKAISSFVKGWMEPKEFLSEVSVEEGGPSIAETTTERPLLTPALVTFEPRIDYRLGLKDRLPNRETLRARALATLPLGLVGAVVQDLALNDSTESAGKMPGPELGLYRFDHVGTTWTAVGFDHQAGDEWFATAQASYHATRPDIRLLGSYSRSLVANSIEPDRYAVEAGLDGMNGTASLWARLERFEVGDTGETLGLTRRFGRTEVAVTWSSSREGSETLRRAGISLRLPLPEARLDAGQVRFASSSQAEFVYRPTESAEPAVGRGVSRRLPFTPEDDLTARGLLTAEMFRAQVGRMRRRL